ncbi:MAG: hypothetical protein J0H99_26475, partial [Rhodospirillales bacterium]|nr:hypothetical protein [Rhodospirillales bacterium]
RAGAWLNLATPLCFYLLVRRIGGAWAAFGATAVLVLYGGATMAGDEAAGYTPWTYTPALVWPAFFLTAWLLIDRVGALRWRDAPFLGAAIALVFLAHTVPALLLAGMTAATVVGTHGLRPRALAWLALTGGVALAGSLPFLLPLLLAYRLAIANPIPGAWVHGLLTPESASRTLLLNLPGLLALPVLRSLPRPAAAAIAAWISLCLLGLARHYACQAGIGAGCRVLVIAPHHYHVYLQAAWACLIGIVLARWLARDATRVAVGLVAAAAVVGAIGTFQHAVDLDRRRLAQDAPDLVLDRTAHAWILRHTSPEALFATPLPDAPDQLGPTVGTVFAAGR